MLGAHCVTDSNSASYQKSGLLYTNSNGLVCIYSVVRDHTARAYYSFDSILNTIGGREHQWAGHKSMTAGPASLCK